MVECIRQPAKVSEKNKSTLSESSNDGDSTESAFLTSRQRRTPQPTDTETNNQTQLSISSNTSEIPTKRNQDRTTKESPQLLEGLRLIREKHYQEAVSKLDEIKPSTFESLSLSGWTLLHIENLSDIHEAINKFNECINMKEEQHGHSKIYYLRAYAKQKLRLYEESIFDYTYFIVASKGKDEEGYLGRGLCYLELGQYQSAVEDLEIGKTVSKYGEYCSVRAKSLLDPTSKQKNYTSFIKQLKESKSQTVEILFYLGISHYELRRFKEARKYLEESLKNTSENMDLLQEAKLYLALIYYCENETTEAVNNLEKIPEIHSIYHRAQFHLGMIHSEDENELSRALDYFNKAHEAAPNRADVLYELSRLQIRLGNHEAAMCDKRKLLKLQSNSEEIRIDLLKDAMSRIDFLVEQNENTESALFNLLRGALLQNLLDSMQNRGLSAEPTHHYYEAIEFYQRGITDTTNFETIFSYLFIIQLSNHHKHCRTAMTCTQLFEDSLEEKKEIKEELLKQKKCFESESNKSEVAEILNSMRTLDSQLMPQNGDNVLKHLINIMGINGENWKTIERLIENINKEDDYIKEFSKGKSDEQQNPIIRFYRKMSRMLAHTLAAMCVTSGVGDEPIIKHDRTGTWHQVGNIISIISQIGGAVAPVGGEAVGCFGSLLGSQIKEREAETYRTRMSQIADVGSIPELTNVAKDVTFRIAKRYQNRLSQLVPYPNDKKSSCCSCSCLPSSCCISCKSDKKSEPRTNNEIDSSKENSSSNNDKTSLEDSRKPHPAELVAIFGVQYMQAAILKTSGKTLGLRSSMSSTQLTECLVTIISEANPTFFQKFKKFFSSSENIKLPHERSDSTEMRENKMDSPVSNKKSDDWYLHDFYQHLDELNEEKNKYVSNVGSINEKDNKRHSTST